MGTVPVGIRVEVAVTDDYRNYSEGPNIEMDACWVAVLMVSVEREQKGGGGGVEVAHR